MRPAVEAGGATCRRCGEPIEPGTPWDVGHVVDVWAGGDPDNVAPEHRACNRQGWAPANAARRARKAAEAGGTPTPHPPMIEKRSDDTQASGAATPVFHHVSTPVGSNTTSQ